MKIPEVRPRPPGGIMGHSTGCASFRGRRSPADGGPSGRGHVKLPFGRLLNTLDDSVQISTAFPARPVRTSIVARTEDSAPRPLRDRRPRRSTAGAPFAKDLTTVPL